MAPGLLVSPLQGTTAASSLICTIISRFSISSSKWRRTTIPLAPKPLRTSHNPRPPRLFCTCSTHLHPRTVLISDFRDAFSNRMAMAGIKPHHRLAIGVSGGPDSMALCVLAAGWKLDACVGGAGAEGGFIEGLLAIIVDHGLRKESKVEADLVCRRVSEMGIRCEVVRCDWSDGRPKQGQLQEAARNMRYQILQNVCIKHQSAVLLTAHHADDQAELFIIRLSRNSGVLGLAGMAFTSHLFPTYGEAPDGHSIMLVRPLLDFSKEDMYEICKAADQEWVEDPSNQSPVFARNRIRMSLGNLSSSSISELRALISACRRTRSYVERICCNLVNQAVTVMPEGYAVIDLKVLNPSKIEDICLSKFLTLVLQFVSQRHRPLRGSASKLLLNYFRSFPCKTSLTAAGCYLCAAPGSKGTSVLVCCSTNSPPPKMEILSYHPCEGRNHGSSRELEQIKDGGNLYSANMVLDGLNVNFLNATSCESVLTEARRLNIISDSSSRSIHLLQSEETKHFKSSAEIVSGHEVKPDVVSDSTFVCEPLLPGEFGYFMNRFVVTWNLCGKINCCPSCVAGHDVVAELRPMIDADWLHLAMLSKCQNFEQVQQQIGLANEEEDTERADSWSQYVSSSAQKAVVSLKSIPAAARRALPVLVNSQGLLLSIPSICFSHCPCLEVSATFKPRVPLGGGCNSFA